MAANLELARAAYALLVNEKPEGVTREQLRYLLKVEDRPARDAVNACRVRAAQIPHPRTGKVFVIGFDPQTKLYCAAQAPEVARRIIAYQEARVEDLNRSLDAQRTAFEQMFGQKYRATEEVRLF